MIDFESYVKSNWEIPSSTSCGIKYTHSTRETYDKKAKVIINNHTITMTLSWYDKDNNLLNTEKLAFVNDDLNKTYEKKLSTINRSELVNKFRNAKPDIVRKIVVEKREKIDKLNSEITCLVNYLGRGDDVIPHSMKNTIEISDSSKSGKANTTRSKESTDKTHFDM